MAAIEHTDSSIFLQTTLGSYRKVCQQCHQPFVAGNPNQHCCSSLCKTQALQAIPSAAHTCSFCGKVFFKRYGRHTFCSRACWAAAPRKAADFWDFVDKSPHPQGCWLWKGSLRKGKYNYGEFRHILAHRYAYELYHPNETLTTEDAVCHSCDNCPCVRDTHLWKGTIADNNFDAWQKGHMRRGTTSHLSKLTEEVVRNILHDFDHGNVTQRALCLKYGVTEGNMSCIVRRETWKHITLDAEEPGQLPLL
jgi:hypothetical protein